MALMQMGTVDKLRSSLGRRGIFIFVLLRRALADKPFLRICIGSKTVPAEGQYVNRRLQKQIGSLFHG